MRKTLLLLAALAGLASTTARAQTERGTTLIGLSASNLGYGRSQDRNFRRQSATLTPTVGRFVADNLLVGVGVQVGYEGWKSDYSGYYYMPATQMVDYGTISYRHRSWSAGVSPFARYYFLGRGRHRLFAEADLQVQRNWSRDQYHTDLGPLTGGRQFTSWGYRAGIGYSYFITPRTALEVSTGYQRTYTPTGSSGKLNARFGVNFLLPAGKR